LRGISRHILTKCLLTIGVVACLSGTVIAQERDMVLLIFNKSVSQIAKVSSKQNSENRWIDCGRCGNGSYFELKWGRKLTNWENCHYDLMLSFESGQILKVPNVDVCERGSITVRTQNNQMVYDLPRSSNEIPSENRVPVKADFLVQNQTDRTVLRLSMTNRADYEWVHKDMELPSGKQMPIVSTEPIQPFNCMRNLKLTLEGSDPYSLGRVNVCRLKLIDVKTSSNGTVVSVVDTKQRNLLFPSLATVSSRPQPTSAKANPSANAHVRECLLARNMANGQCESSGLTAARVGFPAYTACVERELWALGWDIRCNRIR
jgi:hypothetical protein